MRGPVRLCRWRHQLLPPGLHYGVRAVDNLDGEPRRETGGVLLVVAFRRERGRLARVLKVEQCLVPVAVHGDVDGPVVLLIAWSTRVHSDEDAALALQRQLECAYGKRARVAIARQVLDEPLLRVQEEAVVADPLDVVAHQRLQ